MKTFVNKAAKYKGDFYRATLAPVNHRHETRCCGMDIAMLTVLFLELAVVMRLFLAQ